MPQTRANITVFLRNYKNGDRAALENLASLVYTELRQIARKYVNREMGARTLQPTALVNEAFVRLFQGQPVQWESRAHFFNLAAQLMRRILIDQARKKKAHKRGERAEHVEFRETLHIPVMEETGHPDLLALDEAMEKLALLDPRLSKVVELRYFGGLEIEETAEAMGCSTGTVKRDWVKARLWLLTELQKNK